MAATWLEQLLEPERLNIDAHALAFGLSMLAALAGLFIMFQLIRRYGTPDSGLSRSEAILAFPLGIGAFILPSLLVVVLGMPLVSGNPLAIAVVQILVSAVAVFALANHRWRPEGEQRGSWLLAQPRQLMWVPLLWIAGFPVLQAGMFASVQLHEMLNAGVEQQGVVEQLREATTPSQILAWYVMAVVAAPLMEEFVFRVVLFGATRRLLTDLSPAKGWRHPGLWIAFALSIGAFVLAHGIILWTPDEGLVWGWTVGILPLTLLSVILTLLYAHTRSIWPSMLYHALHNAFVVTMQLYVLR
ncbi:MAG: CPBP family intramembrane metalloprotease [Planctomycetes bacterium]|nr:CPBP family intramembrane metalloprotease [Planctomycetota bacterium]